MQHHYDFLNWPFIWLNVTVLGFNWDHFWASMPGPTAVYAFISAAFMVFQMLHTMGLLERFKRKAKLDAVDRHLAELEGTSAELKNQNLADVVKDARGKLFQVREHPDLARLEQLRKAQSSEEH